jgi:hypothetical protein
MYQELFRNHLSELHSRLSKPNCVLLKAIDADSKEILGFVEMSMAACVVENTCDKLECAVESSDGEVYPKDLTKSMETDDDTEKEAVAGDVLKAQSWMNNFNDIDLVNFATQKDIAEGTLNNLLYLPKIANLAGQYCPSFSSLLHCGVSSTMTTIVLTHSALCLPACLPACLSLYIFISLLLFPQ